MNEETLAHWGLLHQTKEKEVAETKFFTLERRISSKSHIAYFEYYDSCVVHVHAHAISMASSNIDFFNILQLKTPVFARVKPTECKTQFERRDS
jgi:hypothetical protein